MLAGLALFVLVQGIDGYDIGDTAWPRTASATRAPGFALWAAFLVEILMTAIFVYVILAVTDARNEHPALAPAAIGLALAMIHFASINLTGTSVNPARSIGVGLFAGSDAIIQLWLFILAPLLGGAIAGFTYPLIFGHGTDPVPGSGLVSRGPRRRRCPATARRTSSSRSGTSRPPASRPRGSRSRSSRTAGSGTTPRRSGSRSSSGSPAPPAQPRLPADTGRPAAPAQPVQPTAAATPGTADAAAGRAGSPPRSARRSEPEADAAGRLCSSAT